MVVYDISKKNLLQFVAIQIKKMKSAAASYTFQIWTRTLGILSSESIRSKAKKIFGFGLKT